MSGDGPGGELDYQALGFGSQRVGLGTRPAVVVVDLQLAFLADGLGTGHTEQTLAAAARVLGAARGAGLPVVYVRVAFEREEDAGIIWREKVPAVSRCLVGTDRVEIHPTVRPAPGELVLDKHWASAFFRTPLHGVLQGEGVDAVVVVGTSTGGCVRATVVDAAQHDYRVTVVADAVEDRSEASHRACLADFDAKYADVVSSDEVVARLGAGRWLRPTS